MPDSGKSPARHRFFCSELPIITAPGGTPGDLSASGPEVSDTFCTLDRQESHHARNVLRLSVGTSIELFDGRGSLARAVLERYEPSLAECRITETHPRAPATPSLTIASAVPKGPRADAMVAQLSQLGVDTFIPLQAEHSVAVPRPNKVERFAQSTIESAKQCHRLYLMRVEQPRTPQDVFADPDYDLKLMATPDAPVVAGLSQRITTCQNILVLIGPEGGFSPGEFAAAADAGCLGWPIAEYILRIETAAAAAAAILRYPTTLQDG